MTTLTVAEYLKYANLQMAAEAFLFDQATSKVKTGQQLLDALIAGNNHASVFTATQAEEFLDPNTGWTVVAQRANTHTGFSGTLFRNNATGELVLSFRSTEFIDDAACDNQATNLMEIKKYGWAFGQIDDMEAWYAELKASGNILPGEQLAVTGYSLGAHLATAFNLLRKEEEAQDGTANPITATYTFNGAGVGDVLSGRLTDVMATFRRLRDNVNGNEIVFADPVAREFYQRFRGRTYLTAGDIDAVFCRDAKSGSDSIVASYLEWGVAA